MRTRVALNMLLALVVASVALGPRQHAQTARKGAAKVVSVIFRHGFEDEVADLALRDLRVPAASAPLPPAAPPAAVSGTLQPYANSERNSRVAAPLPQSSDWKPLWQAPLNPQVGVAFLLAAASRVIAVAGEWRLFDTRGGQIAAQAGGGPMAIDPSKGLFYFIEHSAYFQAARLAAAQPEFIFLPTMGDTYRRILLAARGSRILVAGQERALDPHGNVRPVRSILQIVDTGDPYRVNPNLRLATIDTVGEIVFPSPASLAAAGPGGIAIALPGSLHFVGWDAKVTGSYALPQPPAALSLDEAGRAYVLSGGAGSRMLQAISPAGELLRNVSVPADLGDTSYPPVVAYDRRVFVVGADRIAAYNPAGELQWDRPAIGKVSGAIVTANNILVVSEGNTLSLWNGEGQRRPLFRAAQPLVTPPALNEQGQLFVAGARTLYCLQP